MRLTLAVAVVAIIIVDTVIASRYDPHAFPETRPYFEGWYARLTDHENARSFGILFGQVLPVEQSDDATLIYISLVRSNGQQGMVAVSAAPGIEDISITVKNGTAPISTTDTSSPPDFQWVSTPNGYFNATPTTTVFSMTVDDVLFEGSFGKPVPWAPDGRGPEGWLHDLPLPVHWFVYSLATPGTYKWVNLTTNEVLEGSGYLHQEKNLGGKFPTEWIWTEGYDPAQNVSYAGVFGTLNFVGHMIPVSSMLFGFRNFNSGFSIDFRPDNAKFTTELDPCGGTALVTIWSTEFTVEIGFEANPSSFGTCLCGPVANGFEPIVTESYVATVRIRITHHVSWWDTIYRSGVVVEDVTLQNVALEFGGEYMCPDNACLAKTTCS